VYEEAAKLYAGSQSMELTMSNILQRTDLYLQGDDIIWHPDNDGHRQAERAFQNRCKNAARSNIFGRRSIEIISW